MADLRQGEVTNALHRAGLSSAKNKDAFNFNDSDELQLPDEPGRADTLVYSVQHLKFVEVKNGDTTLPFSEWRENQRQWAIEREADGVEYWLWILLGDDPTHYNPVKYRPRRSWLVPFRAFLRLEESLLPYRKSLIYDGRLVGNAKKRRKDNPEGLSAVEALARYEVPWGKGGWNLQPTHPFMRSFMEIRTVTLFAGTPYQKEVAARWAS